MIDKNYLRESPIGLTVLITAGLSLLMVVAGLFFFLVGLGRPLLSTPVKPQPIPEQWILLVILVLLVIIAVLLLFLLRCCCRSKQGELPRVLSTVLRRLRELAGFIPDAIQQTAVALEHTSVGLRWIDGRIKDAGDTLAGLDGAFSGSEIDTAAHVAIPSISTTGVLPVLTDLGLRNGKLVTGLELDHYKVNLKALKDSLTGAHGPLQNQTITLDPAPPDFVGAIPTDLGTIEGDLHTAATQLSTIASDLRAILALLP
jgi:hypothetical protein